MVTEKALFEFFSSLFNKNTCSTRKHDTQFNDAFRRRRIRFSEAETERNENKGRFAIELCIIIRI